MTVAEQPVANAANRQGRQLSGVVDPHVVLGLHVGHDATAALVVEGELVAAVAEERLSRIKLHYGFPRRAIGVVLADQGLTARDVDVIALGGGDPLRLNPWQVRHIYNLEDNGRIDFSNQVPRQVGRQVCAGSLGIVAKRALGLKDSRQDRTRVGLTRCLRACNLDASKLLVVDHHLSHAVSAYSTSGFDNALALTIDGYGDGINTAVWSCSGQHIERLACGPGEQDKAAYSPGDFYSYVTRYLGFKRNRHEGKITGLAAYASPNDVYGNIEDLLSVDAKRASFSSSVSAFRNSRERRPTVLLRRLARWALQGKMWDPLLIDELNSRCAGATPEQVAAAAQRLFEKRIVDLATYWINETGVEKICLAGGVFANVKLNQRIVEIDGVGEVFVHPNMGDGGLSVGAAFQCLSERQDLEHAVVSRPLDDVFLGPEYSNGQMRSALEASGLMFELSENIERQVAAALYDGCVVARFDGRMEYGPRALGNRSILAAPTDPSINDSLNKRLKRTEFMPFAPAVMREYASEIFPKLTSERTLRFMTLTLDMAEHWRERAPAVCHVDGTARPQLLDEVNTPSFYRIVSAYHALSGLPLVVNTSFNMHEEPIVCTPEDAIRAFATGDLEFLALGPFWVRNPKR